MVNKFQIFIFMHTSRFQMFGSKPWVTYFRDSLNEMLTLHLDIYAVAVIHQNGLFTPSNEPSCDRTISNKSARAFYGKLPQPFYHIWKHHAKHYIKIWMVIICEIRICNFITYSLSTQCSQNVTSACKASSLVMNIFHMVWCKKNLNLNFHGHEFYRKMVFEYKFALFECIKDDARCMVFCIALAICVWT